MVRTHKDLDVWKRSIEFVASIFKIAKSFPKEETCSLTDQIRRSSRSVSGQIAEAWRRRKYEVAFINSNPRS